MQGTLGLCISFESEPGNFYFDSTIPFAAISDFPLCEPRFEFGGGLARYIDDLAVFGIGIIMGSVDS